MTKEKPNIDNGDIPTKEELIERLKASQKRLIDSLISARQVAPEDMPAEERETLDEVIAKAEHLTESIEKALKDK